MFSYDQQKLIACLITAIPLSYIMTVLKKPTHLLAFTIVCSVILQSIVFEKWIILLWIQQNIVYVICKFGPRAKVGKIVFIETFVVLSAVQLVRMYLSYGM